MLRFALALAVAVAGLASGALAAQGRLSNCSISVALTATTVVFPAAGSTGPTTPQSYLAVQNAGSNPIWINPLGTAATAAAPSWQLSAGASFVWRETDPIPPSLSAIATTGASPLSCWYQ